MVESVDPARRFLSLRRVRLSRRNLGIASDALRLRCRWIKGTVDPPLAVVSDKDTDRDNELEESERGRSVSRWSSYGENWEEDDIEDRKRG